MAYILRGPHILDLMTQHYGKPQSVLVVQQVHFYDQDSKEIKAEATETIRYIFPDMFRSETRSENTLRVHVAAKGAALTIIDEKIALKTETVFDLYKDILLYRSRKMMEKRMSYLGIDYSVTSLARFQGKIALVLGAEKPDENLSQIWIDKETFHPIRWLMVSDDSQATEGVMEIRYSEWRSVKGAWYPMHIDYYQNNVLVREIRVESLMVNPFFSQDLFDIERLSVKYLPAVHEVSDGSVSGELNEVDKTIDEFRKKFE